MGVFLDIIYNVLVSIKNFVEWLIGIVSDADKKD